MYVITLNYFLMTPFLQSFLVYLTDLLLILCNVAVTYHLMMGTCSEPRSVKWYFLMWILYCEFISANMAKMPLTDILLLNFVSYLVPCSSKCHYTAQDRNLCSLFYCFAMQQVVVWDWVTLFYLLLSVQTHTHSCLHSWRPVITNVVIPTLLISTLLFWCSVAVEPCIHQWDRMGGQRDAEILCVFL